MRRCRCPIARRNRRAMDDTHHSRAHPLRPAHLMSSNRLLSASARTRCRRIVRSRRSRLSHPARTSGDRCNLSVTSELGAADALGIAIPPTFQPSRSGDRLMSAVDAVDGSCAEKCKLCLQIKDFWNPLRQIFHETSKPANTGQRERSGGNCG